MAERDKRGRSIKATLTNQEYKRLDALFQAKAVVNEMAQGVRLLDKYVAEARKQGATWAEIGKATGMSHQAAHERWSVKSPRNTAVKPKPVQARKPTIPVKREVQESLLV